MKKYRVECNFGSRYFDAAAKAIAFFQKSCERKLDVQFWLIEYVVKSGRIEATQELLDYSCGGLFKSE